MYYEVYSSAAVRLFTADELQELLRKSREKNAKLGVTGMLLYKDGNFMQVLEGDAPVVKSLITTISEDPRHRQFVRLTRGEVQGRQFADWSMGFRDLTGVSAGEVEGYSSFLNTPLTGREFLIDPTRAQRLLLTFKRTM